jgi:hypothetical protein
MHAHTEVHATTRTQTQTHTRKVPLGVYFLHVAYSPRRPRAACARMVVQHMQHVPAWSGIGLDPPLRPSPQALAHSSSTAHVPHVQTLHPLLAWPHGSWARLQQAIAGPPAHNTRRHGMQTPHHHLNTHAGQRGLVKHTAQHSIARKRGLGQSPLQAPGHSISLEGGLLGRHRQPGHARRGGGWCRRVGKVGWGGFILVAPSRSLSKHTHQHLPRQGQQLQAAPTHMYMGWHAQLHGPC